MPTVPHQQIFPPILGKAHEEGAGGALIKVLIIGALRAVKETRDEGKCDDARARQHHEEGLIDVPIERRDGESDVVQTDAYPLHEVVAAAHNVVLEEGGCDQEDEDEHQRRGREPQRPFEQQSEIGAHDGARLLEISFGILLLYPRLRHAGDDYLCGFLRFDDDIRVDEELAEQKARLSGGLCRRLVLICHKSSLAKLD